MNFARLFPRTLPALAALVLLPNCISQPKPLDVVVPILPMHDRAPEQTEVGDVTVVVSPSCRITVSTKKGREAEWQAPLPGGCMFMKDKAPPQGVKLYPTPTNREGISVGPRMVLIGSSLPDADDGGSGPPTCASRFLGIIIDGYNVIVQNPPYEETAECLHPRSTVHVKHYAVAWAAIQGDKRPTRLLKSTRK